MSKKAVCIGINDYPGSNNDLNGCVNDMNDWAELLTEQYSYDVTGLADNEATAEAILSSLANLVENATDGDSLVITFSGHGTYILDGADADESDNYDEAICAYDRNILDDEIRGILNRLPVNTNLIVVSDSCHSGTVTRVLLDEARVKRELATPNYPTLRRYMPMKNHRKHDTKIVAPRHRSFGNGAGMNHLLLSGCTAIEYSYDAWINGQFNGAMSANAISIIRQNPGISSAQLHSELRDILPNRHFNQSPQLEGPDSLRNRPIFS